ncbi:MAG: hypothetical protein F6K17_03070 [Okeania sp. SIO3C4]|nr:hypothetical protein [Okeania sp. SIO3B3]NER01676.1 hypothetical protein [Okeania sp. SIO3C4]
MKNNSRNSRNSLVMNSSGFISYQEKPTNLPDEFKPLVEECRPFYEDMYQYRYNS